jgi:hypothetical protein
MIYVCGEYMKRITFNISEKNYKKLEELCEITERNKTQMIVCLIREEYNTNINVELNRRKNEDIKMIKGTKLDTYGGDD